MPLTAAFVAALWCCPCYVHDGARLLLFTQVIAMVVSAAERDGVRDDRYFSFALKTLARMGRLDLSLRVNEMRER